MKIGLLSDIHGNAVALELCLKYFTNHGISKIYNLGDAIGYLMDPVKVLSLLDEYNVHSLMGNHEAMLLGICKIDSENEKSYRLFKTAQMISDTCKERIRTWLPWHVESLEGRTLLLVHGSPWDPLCGYIYPDTEFATYKFESLGYDAIFMGHTHRPFIHKECTALLVNVGSCGLPRDSGNLSCLAIYDLETAVCSIKRLEFDTSIVIKEYCVEDENVLKCLNRRSPEKQINGEISI
jgi:putative phosphoesterase